MERTLQSLEQCLRTAKSPLGEKMGSGWTSCTRSSHGCATSRGYMVSRMEVAADGKTPYGMVKGKRVGVFGLEFGEKVLWKFHAGKKMEKISARCGNRWVFRG